MLSYPTKREVDILMEFINYIYVVITLSRPKSMKIALLMGSGLRTSSALRADLVFLPGLVSTSPQSTVVSPSLKICTRFDKKHISIFLTSLDQKCSQNVVKRMTNEDSWNS